MSAPFPTIHTKANKAAGEKADGARAVRQRAQLLLDEIDALLSPVGDVSP